MVMRGGELLSKVGTGFRLEMGARNGTRATTASSTPEPLQALKVPHTQDPESNSPPGGVRWFTRRLPNRVIRDLFMHSLILLHCLCGCRSLPAPLYPPPEQDKTCA